MLFQQAEHLDILPRALAFAFEGHHKGCVVIRQCHDEKRHLAQLAIHVGQRVASKSRINSLGGVRNAAMNWSTRIPCSAQVAARSARFSSWQSVGLEAGGLIC